MINEGNAGGTGPNVGSHSPAALQTLQATLWCVVLHTIVSPPSLCNGVAQVNSRGANPRAQPDFTDGVCRSRYVGASSHPTLATSQSADSSTARRPAVGTACLQGMRDIHEVMSEHINALPALTAHALS